MVFGVLALWQPLIGTHIAELDFHDLADRIWRNECSKSYRGLTSWNEGEEFASLGIGHFIWFHQDYKGPFVETFPKLIEHFKHKNIKLPEMLEAHTTLPFKTRSEFYQHFNDSDMRELRDFLFKTRSDQAVFIYAQFEQVCQKILDEVDEGSKQKLHKLIELLKQDKRGLFAMIDYVNFKGSGLCSAECYNNTGWGLKHVLLDMSETSDSLILEFVSCAKQRLKTRVEMAPKERGEARWLKGWNNRLDRYLNH